MSSIVSAISSGVGLLDSLLGSPTQDSVGFFDQASYNPIFVNARPMRVKLRETSKLMSHPIESGQTISDYKIINPKELDIDVVINSQHYVSTYHQIKSYFKKSTLLGFGLRIGYTTNYIIADMPHEETADMFDVITITLHLVEVLMVKPQSTYAPQQPASSASSSATSPFGSGLSNSLAATVQNTVPSGLQQATSLVSSAQSASASVTSYIRVAKNL